MRPTGKGPHANHGQRQAVTIAISVSPPGGSGNTATSVPRQAPTMPVATRKAVPARRLGPGAGDQLATPAHPDTRRRADSRSPLAVHRLCTPDRPLSLVKARSHQLAGWVALDDGGQAELMRLRPYAGEGAPDCWMECAPNDVQWPELPLVVSYDVGLAVWRPVSRDGRLRQPSPESRRLNAVPADFASPDGVDLDWRRVSEDRLRFVRAVVGDEAAAWIAKRPGHYDDIGIPDRFPVIHSPARLILGDDKLPVHRLTLLGCDVGYVGPRLSYLGHPGRALDMLIGARIGLLIDLRGPDELRHRRETAFHLLPAEPGDTVDHGEGNRITFDAVERVDEDIVLQRLRLATPEGERELLRLHRPFVDHQCPEPDRVAALVDAIRRQRAAIAASPAPHSYLSCAHGMGRSAVVAQCLALAEAGDAGRLHALNLRAAWVRVFTEGMAQRGHDFCEYPEQLAGVYEFAKMTVHARAAREQPGP